ncbi:cell division protein FtsZ [Moraxella haemolytica]|uniref:cell division protein FtsZ n=1 Tax=Moraxella TaxID=475 RepID=UPI0025439295|nr:cell division protein FtsZ [Moraxella sp. ZY171148]WII94864.1 cell division protein FtsZ [Moraxella sp. ZY171148]
MSKYSMSDDAQFGSDGQARFIVFGVGGGGGNAVEHMVHQQVTGINFVAANTDRQALNKLTTPNKLQLGSDLTRGLGAGANPEVGREAAESDEEEIRALLSDYDMVFITAGMGGGTGTGAAPVIARIAKEKGILTVAVVTTPFKFEGGKRAKLAQEGIEQLSQYVDSIITVPNEKLLQVYRGLTMKDAFAKANDVLLQAVDGITRTIREPGVINIDFNDVHTAMTAKGHAMMGIGRASGEGRAAAAAEKAIRSPLLDDLLLKNAQGVIINIVGANIGMSEPAEVAEVVGRIANIDEGNIFYGAVDDESMGDDIYVTVIATGLTVDESPKVQPANPQAAPAGHTAAISSQGAPQAAAPQSQSPTRPVVKPLSVGSFLNERKSTITD